MTPDAQLKTGRVCVALLWLAVGLMPAAGAVAAEPDSAPKSVELFNGRNLDGWVNVNGASDTWTVRDGVLVCNGKPSGFLRSADTYENFVLEWECRHAAPGGNSGVFVYADALPQVGAPYPKSVEIQLLDGDHGSLFGIRGASILPLTNPDLKGSAPRARPTENRCRPAGQWNRYVLTSKDGALELAVNGGVVTKAFDARDGERHLREGYIGLQSEGSEIQFRKLRVTRLPAGQSGLLLTVEVPKLRSLFDGLDFSGWKFREEFRGHWVAQDGVVRCDGQIRLPRGQSRDLWTEREYDDFMLVVDWRLLRKPEPKKLPTFTPDGLYVVGDDGKPVRREIEDAGDSGIYLRGSSRAQVNIWCQPMGSGDINDYHKDATLPIEIRRACVPKTKADHPPGQWNRFVIAMRGERVTVFLNSVLVIENAQLPGVPPRGPIALQNHNDPVEFRNLFLTELKAVKQRRGQP